MYTGRKVFGVLTLAAAGGALAFALKSGPVTKEYVVNPTDPFGNPLPPFVETRTETGRPNLVPGLAALGAIAGATAIEAFVHARRVNASEQRFSAGVEPFADGLALRVTRTAEPLQRQASLAAGPPQRGGGSAPARGGRAAVVARRRRAGARRGPAPAHHLRLTGDRCGVVHVADAGPRRAHHRGPPLCLGRGRSRRRDRTGHPGRRCAPPPHPCFS